MPALPLVTVRGKKYFADLRLGELRQPFEEGSDAIPEVIRVGASTDLELFPYYVATLCAMGNGESRGAELPRSGPDPLIAAAWESDFLGDIYFRIEQGHDGQNDWAEDATASGATHFELIKDNIDDLDVAIPLHRELGKLPVGGSWVWHGGAAGDTRYTRVE